MYLEIEDLSKKIGKQTIFDHVSFAAEKSDVIALIGRNGSGKTTLLQNIMTVMTPDSGDVLIEGKSVYDNPGLLEKMVLVPDRFDYFKFTNLKKVIEYFAILYDGFDRKRAMDEFNDLGISIDKSMNTLSKGQLTLTAIILNLCTGAEIMLIDEPYDGIDVVNRKKIDEFIVEMADSGKVVIVSSHNLDKLEMMATKTVYLETGRSGILLDEQKLNQYYKYQIVYKEEEGIEFDKESDVILLQKIGRVVTILTTRNQAQMNGFLNSDKVSQYDILKLKTEDLFFWDQKKGGI